MITIVDYGVGNIGALLNMLEYLGIDSECSGDQSRIASADRLILPGVGSFDRAMRTLRERELIPPLEEAVLSRRAPVLGVCLGMQLLARTSEEGSEMGLGWIPADVIRIPQYMPTNLKIPHIGWAMVAPARDSELFSSGSRKERFYFDHSFVVRCDSPEHVAATFEYGTSLTCAVKWKNISGVQFHPEKSHRFGMRLLDGWAKATVQ